MSLDFLHTIRSILIDPLSPHASHGLPVDPSGDWRSFYRVVFENQLQGIVFHRLENFENVPLDVMKFFENAYYFTFALNTKKIRELEEMEKNLLKENISVLMIKGAALLDTAYPDPGKRPMEDIDLVVRTEDFLLLEKVLIKSGYTNKGTYARMFSKNTITIDVHIDWLHADRIKSRDMLMPDFMNRAWKASRPWKPGFSSIRKLNDGDHLIFLAHHMIKHSFSKMIWVNDVYRIFKLQDDHFWDEFDKRVIAERQEKPVAYMLYVLNRVVGFSPPEWSVFSRFNRRLTPGDRFILNMKIRAGSMGDLGNVLWLFCLPTFLQKLRFFLEFMFPKRAVGQGGASDRDGKRMNVHRLSEINRRIICNLRIVGRAIFFSHR